MQSDPGSPPPPIRPWDHEGRRTTRGRAFRYVDEAAVLEHREARKRKRESNAVD